jgi:integrase
VELFYVDRRRVERLPVEVEGGPTAAAVVAVLERRVLSDGMPVALDAAMRPIEPLCSWFRYLAHQRRDPKTMRAYAQIVRRLAAFLERRGVDLLSASEVDLVAFYAARTGSQDVPIGDATWDKDKAAIKNLYGWLDRQGHVSHPPYPVAAHRGPMGSAMSRELKVRHMTLEQYTYFRDVGLGGMLPDGQVDVGFRGWAPHRNRAALELALMTGMRLREWSTVLLPELGIGGRRPAAGVEFTLQECAKYGLERTVWVPAAALDAVDVFVMLERSEVVVKAQRSLRRRFRDLFVVDEVDTDAWKLHGVYEGRRREFRIEALDPRLRGLAVVEGDLGLEPLAVFVGHGGGMLGPSRWDGVRREAWTRMLAHAQEQAAPDLPRRAWRFHDARHTFALQLLITLIDRSQERAEARRRGERHVSRDRTTMFSAVLTVQKALGHKQISSTYHYLNYLDDPMGAIDETFRAWAMRESATYAEIGHRVLAGRGVG